MACACIWTIATRNCRRRFATHRCRRLPTCWWSAARKPKPAPFPSATGARATWDRNRWPKRTNRCTRKLPRARSRERSLMSASPAVELQAPRVFLTDEFFADAVGELTQRDGDLAAVVAKYGRPKLWVRDPGFP